MVIIEKENYQVYHFRLRALSAWFYLIWRSLTCINRILRTLSILLVFARMFKFWKVLYSWPKSKEPFYLSKF